MDEEAVAALHPHAEPPAPSLYKRLDAALFRAERWVAGILFLVMALVMFTNVMHRIFSRPRGKLGDLLLWLLGKFGASPDPDAIYGWVSTVLLLLLLLLVAYAAVRSMSTPRSRWRSLGLAIVVAGGIAVGIALLLWLFPNGLVWGPVFSLSCMLWVSFLGASMATYERRHLALEMGEKIWPAPLVRYVQALAWLAAAGICAFLLALSFLSIRDHHATWMVNHLAGNLLPTGIPKWVVFLIFPYTFVVMTVRFVTQGILSALGRAEPKPEGLG